MNLAKALKEKNKKAKQISKLIQKVLNNNVYSEGEQPAYDSKILLEEVRKAIAEFVEFKTKLFNATAPIRSKIFEMGELRSLMSNLNSLQTGKSAYNHLYGMRRRGAAGEETEVKNVVAIGEKEKDELLLELEGKIEKLQDEIDVFNATTQL